MTPQFLRDLQSQILANEECAKFVHTNDSDKVDGVTAAADDASIAAIISVGRKRVVQGPVITTRGAAAAFPSLNQLPGALAFQLAFRKLTTFATAASASPELVTNLLGDAITLQLESFHNLGLDFGSPALRDMLDLIVLKGAITAEEAAGFKALAEVPDAVTGAQVGRALRGPWGDEG